MKWREGEIFPNYPVKGTGLFCAVFEGQPLLRATVRPRRVFFRNRPAPYLSVLHQ